MPTLLIETSTERGFTAIFKGNELLFQKELPFGYNNSKYLLPTVEEALQTVGLVASQLALIAVGVGPGSYTGMRIAAIIAKTLSYACKRPLVGICTLESFLPRQDCSFGVIIDAKIGGAYLLKGRQCNGIAHYTSTPALYSLEKLEIELSDVDVLVTPYKEILQAKLQALYPKLHCEWQEEAPSPFQMLSRAQIKFSENLFSIDGKLELLYLRKTQAEIEQEHKKTSS